MQKIIKDELKVFIGTGKSITEFIDLTTNTHSLKKDEVIDYLFTIQRQLKRFVPINTSFINAYTKKHKHLAKAKELSKMTREEYNEYKKSQNKIYSLEEFKNLFKYEEPAIIYENKAKEICNKMRSKYN